MGVSLWKGRCCRHDKGRVLVVPECTREDTKQACLRQPEEKAALRDRHRKGSREKPAKLVRHDQAALGTLLVKFKLKGPHRCECRRGVHQHQANPLGQQRAERTLGDIVAISPGQHIFEVGVFLHDGVVGEGFKKCRNQLSSVADPLLGISPYLIALH